MLILLILDIVTCFAKHTKKRSYHIQLTKKMEGLLKYKMRPYSTLPTTPQGRCDYPHSIDQEMKAQNCKITYQCPTTPEA